MFFNIKVVLLGLFLIGILVYYMSSKEGMVNKKEVKRNINFIQSDKFNGSKKGYVFKMDKQGLGYYIDN
mgnify:CR=1 FL=1